MCKKQDKNIHTKVMGLEGHPLYNVMLPRLRIPDISLEESPVHKINYFFSSHLAPKYFKVMW